MFLKTMPDLDDVNLKILELLSENARLSYVDIGKVVGLSRVAVKNRILALEEQGIIEKYTVIINPHKIGRSISAYFEVAVSPVHYHEAIEILSKSHNITKIYQVTGTSKFHVHSIFKNEEEMNDLLTNTVYKIPGLTDLYFNIIISRIKDVTNVIV